MNKVTAAKAGCILTVIPALIIAYSSGAPPRSTGAPGDQTCAQSGCHTGTAVNGGGGRVEIAYSGGSSYVPGQRGKFTVTITDSAARLYGFESSARLTSNLQSGQAGNFVEGQGTLVQCEDGRIPPCRAGSTVQFITQSLPSRNNTFEFDWTPPDAGAGDVRVYVAANAANGNGQNSGDRIYTANITLTPAPAAGNRPAISEGGIADAFNFQRGVALNTWTAIFGQNLSTETRNWDGSPEFAQGRLPLSLGGVSVTINGRPAPVFFVSPGQINVLAPTDDATGNVQVIVKSSAGESAPVTVTRTQVLPAIYAPFAQNSLLFVTAVENSTGAILGKPGVEPRAARAFRPGDVVQFFATGLGPTNPSVPADQVVRTPAALVNAPAMRINNVPVQILGAAYVGSGLYQVNGVIPDVPNGDQPVVLESGGSRSSNSLRITIQR